MQDSIPTNQYIKLNTFYRSAMQLILQSIQWLSEYDIF